MKFNIDGSVILGIVAVVLLGVVLYYVARFLKGRLTLELSSRSVDSQQPLSGSLTLQAKKNINGLLIVALVGRREKRRRTSKRSSTEWVEVFRQENVLEEQREFPAGFLHQYQFTFVAPTAKEARSGDEAFRRLANKVSGVLATALNLTADTVGMRQGRISWHVEARLDAAGVDLYTDQGITVNLRD
jgi:hypothetical protein